MSEPIFYNYAENHAVLDTLKASVNDIETLRQDVATVFTALSDVYQGTAAEAFQQAHRQMSQKMDQVHADMLAVLAQAVERQYITAAQDQQLAQNF